MTYNPFNWYWQADDGRVFASAQSKVVDKTDAGLTSFTASSSTPTPWPRDDTGAQTTAALDGVLRPYGLSTSGKVRTATVSVLLDALSIEQRATITPDHMSRLVARAAVGAVVVTDPKVKRAADDLSIAPDAWFTLAGA